MMASVTQDPEYNQFKHLLTKAFAIDSIAKQWAVDQVDSCLEGVSRNVLLVDMSKAVRKKSQREHQTFYDGVPATVVGTGAEGLILKRDMCDEMERCVSFLHKNWPSDAPVSSRRLANTGFFCIGVNDTGQCFSCMGRINHHGDTAIGEHKRLYPKCKFVRATDQRNVPYNDLVDGSQKGTDIKLQPKSGAPSSSRIEISGSEGDYVRVFKPSSLQELKLAKTLDGCKPEITGLLSLRSWPITNPVDCYYLAGFFVLDEHFIGQSTPPQPLAVEQPVKGSGLKILVRPSQLKGLKSEDGNNAERKPKRLKSEDGKNAERKPKKGSIQEQVKGKPFRKRSHSWSKRWLSALFLFLQAPSVISTEVCPENQTTELGTQGFIICHFPNDYSEVHWFDNISGTSSPVISFKPVEGDKYGPGLESGIYDVHEDGSLIITNVSTWYERVFKTVVFKKSSLAFAAFVISLKVIASPVDDLPVIPCCNCHQDYYYIAMQGENLSCSYNATRPPVQLEWFKKFSDGYEHLEMQQFNTTENSNGTFNSLATVHFLQGSRDFIHLLVCKATWPLSDWRKERKILVDFSSNLSFSDVTPKIQHMEINRYAEIQCGQSASVYVVWKRIIPNSEPEVIGFHSHVMREPISDIPDVEVSAEGSLTFSSPSVQHEGMYVCISGDGQKEEIQMTSVEILIAPSPPYIQIAGCSDDPYPCVIRKDNTKELTCSVYGARPNVTLEWIAEDEDDIAFFNHKLVSEERGETFDTILSVEYKVSQDVLCGKEIIIKCHLYGPLSNIMKAESTALVIPAFCREYEGKEEHGPHGAVIALVVLCVLIVIVIAPILVIYIGCNGTNSRRPATYNGVPSADAQDASLKADTKGAGGQIPNGTTFCIVKDTGEECGLKDSKEGSASQGQDE